MTLDDAAIERLLPRVKHRPGMTGFECYSFGDVAHAVRAAIEQYAAEQCGSGEPVAWLYKIKMRNRGRMEYASVSDSERRDDDITDAEWATRIVEPLYSAPPKREPLTEDEIAVAYRSLSDNDRRALIEKM